MGTLLSRLDPWLFRYPFEGRSARRYADDERRGFGDLDDRLIHAWHDELAAARTVLDVGAGPGTFTAKLASAYPHLRIVAVEPSADFTGARPGVRWIRARAEALPLAAGSIDVAVCLSSIRHVRDRAAALRELRRVVVPGGALYIVELDPAASPERIREHSRRMRTLLSRLVFGPLVVRPAPPAAAIAAIARSAGWGPAEIRPDTLQPVYVMRMMRVMRPMRPMRNAA